MILTVIEVLCTRERYVGQALEGVPDRSAKLIVEPLPPVKIWGFSHRAPLLPME